MAKINYQTNLIVILDLLMVLLFFSSCNTTQDKDINKRNISAINEFNKSHAFIKDVPLKAAGSQDKIYLNIKNGLEKLGLEKIDTLYNNFQIRITNDFDNSGKLQLLSLKLEDSSWKGWYYRFAINRDDTTYKDIKADSFDVSPKDGWPNFINELISQDILYLPTMQKIPNFHNDLVHGEYCFFEIASKNRYRFYYYNSPKYDDDIKIIEFKKIKEILKIIETNFAFESKSK